MNTSAQTQVRRFHFVAWLSVFAIATFLSHAALAGTFNVTNTNNTGLGSLRAAIILANQNQAMDTIVFNLPGAGPHIITLTSELPVLTSNLEIINDRQGDEVVTVRRSSVDGAPNFRVFTIDPGLMVTIAGLSISNGRSMNGGGILNQGSDLTLRNSTVRLNEAQSGGAIYNLGGSSGQHAKLTLVNCIISENTAKPGSIPPSNGGGIVNRDGTGSDAVLTATNCLFSRNAAPAGGGIINGGGNGVARLILVDCSFQENSASSGGGAISNLGGNPTRTMASISNCTFSGNSAGGVAGAIYNISAALTLTNSTISGNTGAFGGGVVNVSAATAVITNCTFYGNVSEESDYGLSLGNQESTMEVGNTIFLRTVNGPHIYNVANGGNFISRGHNMSDDDAGGPAGTGPGGLLNAGGDQRNTDPLLLPLGDYGGPTETHALRSNSPAINAGDDAQAPELDQRGVVRSGVSDIGAFEFSGAAPSPTPPPSPTPVPARLANIATRLRVETGDNVLIGGFIITGTQPKKIIVRGIGTSLPFADRLANPTLELRDASGALLDSNDNWVDSPNKQAIIDSTIPPSSDFEAAIVATLAANNSGYTAIVRGAGDSTGIGVVEAYDLDSAADSKLANISTRGLVQTGDNVLIAGMIVTGETSQKVILRAIGPSLPIAGRLENPTLELRDGNGALLEANDNWVDSPNKQAIIDSTIPPADNFESAIVFTLPGNNSAFTAIVRGAGDTTGIAVVEVYALN